MSHTSLLKCIKFVFRHLCVRSFDRVDQVDESQRRRHARDGGDRDEHCWCAEAVRVSLSVCSSLRWNLALKAEIKTETAVHESSGVRGAQFADSCTISDLS